MPGHLIDDSPLTSFHKKLALYSSGGPFIDGYALSIVGVALITLEPALSLTSTEIGLIGAASLVGFSSAVCSSAISPTGSAGSSCTSPISLRWRCFRSCRRSPEKPGSSSSYVSSSASRSVPTTRSPRSLLAEYSPKKYRGFLLGAMFVVWAIGAAAAFVVAYLLRGVGPDAWRYLLASPAVFAVITLLARLGTPESARWLLSKGRTEQADAAVKKVFGPQYSLADLPQEPEVKTAFIKVFQKPYLRHTVFVAVFWTAQVIPLFAVYTFAPDLLESFGLKGDANLYGGSLIISLLFVAGGFPGLYLVERIGRRKLLLGSFVIIAVALAVPIVVPHVPAWLFFLALAVFAVSSGASSFLEVVYPNELFPTEVRATGVGVGTATSRIGSAGEHLSDAVGADEHRRLGSHGHRGRDHTGRIHRLLFPGARDTRNLIACVFRR